MFGKKNEIYNAVTARVPGVDPQPPVDTLEGVQASQVSASPLDKQILKGTAPQQQKDSKCPIWITQNASKIVEPQQ